MISTNRKTEIAELISDTVFKADHITIEKSQKTHNFVEVFISFNMPVLYRKKVLKGNRI